MGTNGKMENLLFQIKLLTQTSDLKRFPFTKLVIQHQLTEEEYEEIFHLLDKLNDEFIQQKEEGFLNFEPLLLHFVGMLTTKLNPFETIDALKKEGHYPSLMDVFLDAHKQRVKTN
ncbi:DUF1878 family protein [Aquibacillus salsiterrae]|uniref:YhaI family protein n=1 Tax=Aquibacillus salsiterrae TaxID=2950439 RepID=A0A9X3WCG9_9BACI|nr:DUF1878 family protein [Aquibacillus salsiterrae]MDC3417275.1 YhaI family protein [Aquibacillus salsiterrae]